VIVRLVLALAIAVCAPACDLVFSLERLDEVPHVPLDHEAPGDADLTIDVGARVSVETSGADVGVVGDPAGATFEIVGQDGGGLDLVVMHVRDLTVDGVLSISGTRPFVIIARDIVVHGTIDGSANLDKPGPGGGIPDIGMPGQGGMGNVFMKSHSGGGGGGFAPGAGSSGTIMCGGQTLGETAGGPSHGGAELATLAGGGAGGRGGFECMQQPSPGGAGGGALQLSATGTITIDGGAVLAGGGGGFGGAGGSPCDLVDGAGSGGGAGGAIYLDAPAIDNRGTVAANGGGGGAGADTTTQGLAGNDATDPTSPGEGGFAQGKGTRGGHGAVLDGSGAPGMSGTCVNLATGINTGGGGGASGRIVFRGKILARGTPSPSAKILARTAQ